MGRKKERERERGVDGEINVIIMCDSFAWFLKKIVYRITDRNLL